MPALERTTETRDFEEDVDMKCDAYRILIAELEDGGLDAEEAELLRRHLDMCESCRAYQEGRHAATESRGECSSLSGELPYGPEPVAQSEGRSWGWAVVAVIGFAVLVALILMLGLGRWSHRGPAHPSARVEKHTVLGAP